MSNIHDKIGDNVTVTALSSGTLHEDMVEMLPPKGMNRFMLLVIAMAMVPWLLGDYNLFGFKISGWSWVIPELVACLLCLRNIDRITFPVRFWLPWIVIMCVYCLLGKNNPDAIQTLVQMLSPLIVGCAASIFRLSNLQLENVVHWITRLTWIVWILLLVRMPMIIVGILPGYGFMTAEMVGLLLLGALYASFYAGGSARHLYYYLAMLVITFISLTRGPIVAMLSCLPLTFAPLSIRKRIVLCTMVFICGLIIFNTERMQDRMFFSGGGDVNDLRWDNPDFATSGRSVMWNIMWDGVEREPLLGNGWNYHRIVLPLSGIRTYAPHNDWLKLLHDLGIVGVVIYLISNILQMFSLARIARWSTGAHKMLAYGVATAFVPYMLIMFTDNVVLYVQFFGNLHFALIGIIYGAVLQDDEEIGNV